jgi:TrmH RNA methyltransferase
MSNDDERPPSPYKGPPRERLDKRARERQRAQAGLPAARDDRPPRAGERGPRGDAPRHVPSRSAPVQEDAPSRDRSQEEQRFYGVNACLALFQHRPEALRKLWLLPARMPAMKAVLAWCVANRIGYTLVEDEDLARLSGSQHHEGVVFGALPPPEQNLSAWLRFLPAGPQLALWLDGVGNPHNLGAILRSAAHFGASALLLPKDSPLHLSGAAARVAEGGAEAVPIVRLGRSDNAIAQLQSAGFTLAATVVRGGESVLEAALPKRAVVILGAEQAGIDPALAQAIPLRLSIPGTGAVDSLNVAAATAVLLAEWRRSVSRES